VQGNVFHLGETTRGNTAPLSLMATSVSPSPQPEIITLVPHL
jgi:hypothetical protein